jgi:DHA2 family methylenomycin A resistance protein-like MFS transporter
MRAPYPAIYRPRVPLTAPTSTRPRRVLATVTAAQVVNVASTTIVAVALPDLGAELGASPTELQWVVDAFVLVFASLLIAGGVAGDRYGRRRALLTGLVVFAVGSLWCAVAPSIEWLLAGRVVQALGPPLTLPASLAIVTATFTEPRARARAIGVWGAGSGVGLAIGPLLGGVLVDGLGWRWVFGINVPVCAVLVALALAGVPRDRPGRPGDRFDAAAAALLTAAVALLVYALIEGRELGWGSAPVLGAFAGSALLGGAFVRRELRHPAPLVDIRLLGERAFFAANLGGATLYGALTATAVYVSVFLQQVQGRSALTAGLWLLPVGVLTAACAPVAGRMMARAGARPPILAGLGAACLAFVALLRLDPGTSFPDVWWAFALLGVGTGLALPPMTATAVGAVRAQQAGMASAIHNASRQIGQTFAVAILGTILFARAGDAADQRRPTAAAAADWAAGLHLALVVAGAALACVAVAIAVLLRRVPA